MKRDEAQRKRAAVSSSRPIPRPEVPDGGPLRQLKELLHSLYVEAGTPVLDDIVRWIEPAYAAGLVPSVPSRDRVGDCLGSSDLPTKQSDAITIAETLASHGRRNSEDTKDHVRQLWAAAYEWTPFGRLITDLDDPFALEVHRAIDAAQGHLDLPLLPPYLERDHDRELIERARKAAEGRSTMVVLVGGSSTGKTRACWEVIHKLPTGWRLWHPFDPTRPEAALDTLQQIGPRTVVWLNETQHYLLTSGDLGERVAAKLQTLLADPKRTPVLVLGTTWREHWATLTTTPGTGQKDPHAQARTLLTGSDISVPDAFTGSALIALQAAAGDDPRLAQAQTHAQDGQITQFLAGVPALLDRYRNASPPAKALIEAAMDVRRLGHSLALPHALLEAAVAGSLTDQQWDELREDWLEQAMAYTAAPCRGVRGPLSRIRPRPGQHVADTPHYRLSDYLEQHGLTTRRARATTAALWDALVAHATRKDLVGLGWQAQHRGLYRYAFQLYQAAADGGDTNALELAAELLAQVGRTEEAITWLQARAEADFDDTDALREAGKLLALVGRTEDAITWLQAGAEAGDIFALGPTANLLAEVGRIEEAITYFQRAAEAGDPTALREAADLLVRLGRTDEAITWLQTRAEAGDTYALGPAAHLLAQAGRTDEAITYIQRATEVSDTIVGVTALQEAADLLVRVGRTDEAITWLQTRAEAGDISALGRAARLLAQAERTDEAITYFQRAAEAGDNAALQRAAHLLAQAGRTDEAITWLQTRAEAGDISALGRAARLLAQAERTHEAITYFQRATEAGDTTVLQEAADLLMRVGRTDEAITYIQRATEAGDIAALQRAARLLSKVGRTDEAITYFQRATEAGDIAALQRAAHLLVKAGRANEAVRLRQYGIEPGAGIADSWTCERPD